MRTCESPSGPRRVRVYGYNFLEKDSSQMTVLVIPLDQSLTDHAPFEGGISNIPPIGELK
jgi:hypothetical protein